MMTNRFILLGGVLLSLCAPGTVARAALPVEGDTYALAGAPVAPGELATQRGGFMDPGGVLLRFAVDVHAQIDGTLTFVRSLLVAPDQNGQLQTASGQNLQSGPLPAGSSVTLINNGTGVLYQNAAGQQTRLLSQTPGGLPSSIVTNTMNNLTIGQTVRMDLTLQNMQGVLNNITAESLNTARLNVMQSLRDTQVLQGY